MQLISEVLACCRYTNLSPLKRHDYTRHKPFLRIISLRILTGFFPASFFSQINKNRLSKLCITAIYQFFRCTLSSCLMCLQRFHAFLKINKECRFTHRIALIGDCISLSVKRMRRLPPTASLILCMKKNKKKLNCFPGALGVTA